ncbi:hypothetical protein BUALT_Bualt12G0113000 [Buddleja alternifolia]|uniref:F-box associated beta-propeller type 1 domain-containing protein n=1 Tax=Buddleja alternifolia TaxID=168488 RepID=A0AAV6WS09_9LAMI|nr:hypothetical protein BUALT_Bualt12G0113000 [Buddleja alternifolia]
MLPTKTLVKFQGVCKAWRDLIRDSIFIKNHLRNWASKGNNYLLCVPFEHTPGSAFTLLCAKTFERALNIPIPFEPDAVNLIVIGSYNGLLTVRIVSRDEDAVEGGVNVNFGFCYEAADCKTDVFSMITDLWKKIEVDYFPWDVLDMRSKSFLNESVHWMANHRDVNEDIMVILAFHFAKEVFQQISLPNYEDDGDDLIGYTGIIKGNLSLFLFHLEYRDPWEEKCYLWVMKEYGVVASWTKMYSITIIRSLRQEEQGYFDLVPYTESLVLLEDYDDELEEG